MLQIKNISKTYTTGTLVQQALDNVSLNLRDNEFVAILGPSGSGKTTLLNIIGGLDQYDDGDLIINNVSTKNYKDRDWDTYRNHTIGFVFQSYNLIPHQTVLKNVELALTIGGISRKERTQRALDALDKVGLKEQAHKKPNQMSGGQMQRVAIARALVNNPDILLADEPTGALDSKTSVQIMDLLKEVAKDRLVVMVTHNPELANEYATRIVNLKDGYIIGDSNPYDIPDMPLNEKPEKVKKAHMSFLTALTLSFNNLLTKKGRTILIAFAGSIGIIGIALILSLSTGFQRYIDKIQEDTLSSYPLSITSETADTTSAILSMVADRQENQVDGDRVRERQYMTTMFSSIGSNDLKSFKYYLETHEDEFINDVSYYNYTYSVKPEIYTIDVTDTLVKLNPSNMMGNYITSSSSLFSFGTGTSVFSEMNDNLSSYEDQYDVLAGRWPENYDELLIVLSEPNSISDLLVYSLGLRDTSELRTIMNNLMSGEESGVNNEPLEFTYSDLMNLDLRLIIPNTDYKYNVEYDVYEDMTSDDAYMRNVYDKALKLKVVGIVAAKDSASTMALNTGVNYTKNLTRYVIDQSFNTSIVKKQLSNKNVDVFSGKRFDEENEEEENRLNFEDMITVDEDMLKNAFKINVSEDDFSFDMLSEDEILKIVMDSSKTAADSINNAPDKTTIAAFFSTVNTYLLNSKIIQYETTHIIIPGMNQLRIVWDDPDDDNDLTDVSNSINKDSYKDTVSNIMDTIAASNPEYKDAAAMLNILSDDQYSRLAEGVKSMFKQYYDSVETLSVDGVIDYSITPNTETGTNTITYGSGETAVTNTQLIGQVLTTNQTALTNTAAVTNEIMENLLTYMIAAQIGVATGKIMEPMVDSLSSLGDLMNEDMMTVDTDAFAKAFKFNMDQDELQRLMESLLSGTGEKSYSNNLVSLGYQDVDEPTSINFYFKDFDSKERFLDFIQSYNDSVDEEKEIRYTDVTGLLMSSVKTIVDVVTYVLIAFVSISLVVSSIMIAVITLISVMERTKEIGILRAMGASKRNVSSIFNAETFIIGLLSGSIGVGVTLALIPPINALIHKVSGNYDVNAVFPYGAALSLIIISIVLTVLAGIIPSKKAAKQDPVIALRTE